MGRRATRNEPAKSASAKLKTTVEIVPSSAMRRRRCRTVSRTAPLLSAVARQSPTRWVRDKDY